MKLLHEKIFKTCTITRSFYAGKGISASVTHSGEAVAQINIHPFITKAVARKFTHMHVNTK